MDEQLNTTGQGQDTDTTGATSAETQNTDTTGAGVPGPIPYERFKAINDEARNLKDQLAKLQKAQEEARRAGMSEVERLKAEKAELEERAKQAVDAMTEMRMRDAFRRAIAAAQIKLVDGAVDDAYLLADLTGVRIEESGAVHGMDSVVKSLVKAKPYLVAKPEPPASIDASAGTGSGQRAIPETNKQKIEELRQRFRIP